MIRFKELTESQVLALAITAEEEDAHIYRDFAESLLRSFLLRRRYLKKWQPRKTVTATA